MTNNRPFSHLDRRQNVDRNCFFAFFVKTFGWERWKGIQWSDSHVQGRFPQIQSQMNTKLCFEDEIKGKVFNNKELRLSRQLWQSCRHLKPEKEWMLLIWATARVWFTVALLIAAWFKRWRVFRWNSGNGEKNAAIDVRCKMWFCWRGKQKTKKTLLKMACACLTCQDSCMLQLSAGH